MLALRPATVVHAHKQGDAERDGVVAPVAGGQRLTVELQGEGGVMRRQAIADTRLVGRADPGDRVIVSLIGGEWGTAAAGLCLVHVNLTRGLDGGVAPGGGCVKLAGSSLGHGVPAVDDATLRAPIDRPVAVLEAHAQLPALAWACDRARPGLLLGYVQTDGGALGSTAVPLLRRRGLLAGHITAGAAFGGELEAMSIAGAIHHGLRELGWDAAVAGPGAEATAARASAPGGAVVALDAAHAALALGCPTLLVASMAERAGRTGYRALSDRTLGVLDLLLEPVTVALPAGMRSPVGADLRASLGDMFGAGERRPEGEREPDRPARITRHDWRRATVDLPAFAASGADPDAGHAIGKEPLYFAAALAGGAALAELVAAEGVEGPGEAA